MKSFVRVKLAVPGLHHWSGAPEKTAFLRHPHRHMFIFEVDLKVTHTDRDVEFFDFQQTLHKALQTYFDSGGQLNGLLDFDARSCEMIAEWVLERFPNALRCTVSEDGENLGGAER